MRSFLNPIRAGLFAVLVAALPTLAAADAPQQTYLKVSNRTLGITQQIAVAVGKSMIVDLPTNVGEVIVSLPTVATAVMRSKTRAIVQGIAGGDTNIFFLDGAGNNIAVLDIKVVQPRSDVGNALEAAIARNIPGSRITVESVTLDGSTNRVVLSGTALSEDDVSKAVDIAVQFAGDPKNVASIVSIAGNQQVKLKVQVAEVARDTVKQLGINLDGTISVGPVTMGFSNIPPNGGASGVTNTNGFEVKAEGDGYSLDAQLKALERRGAVRTLAEPTLTTMSGQEASFLAGGEFPVPTDVSDGKVTYTFKQFGVQLKFTPTVKSNGNIGLSLDTSVSELSTEGGISAGGVVIPATKNRQAKTTVELPAGQTLAIAGMLQDTIRQQINQFPGLGNVPILGALFRSRDFIRSQTELVILVTPYLASVGVDTDKPSSSFSVAGDAEAIFLGRMEKMYGVGEDGMRGSYSGSVGFVLD
ncbi:MAG: type II and III secretion system protein family protein [Devosia sp.]